MITFIIRTFYDFIRHFFRDWFTRLRKDSYKYKTWSYAVFFFSMIIIVDFLPTLLFILNLKYIWINEIVISKKMVSDRDDYYKTPQNFEETDTR